MWTQSQKRRILKQLNVLEQLHQSIGHIEGDLASVAALLQLTAEIMKDEDFKKAYLVDDYSFAVFERVFRQWLERYPYLAIEMASAFTEVFGEYLAILDLAYYMHTHDKESTCE